MRVFFTSTKFPMCTRSASTALGPQACERTDAAVRADDGVIDDAVGEHLGAGGNLRVADQAVGADSYAVAQLDVALQHHVHIDHYVLPDRHLPANIDARRVDERGTVEHELAGLARAPGAFRGGQLDAVVDALHFLFIGRDQRAYRHPIADRQAR